MIYLDTSVALAHLLAEDRTPPPGLWAEVLVSSRLLEYELFNVMNARRLKRDALANARSLISRIAFVELAPPVLARALEPFPAPVRTLDALHLASLHFLVAQQQSVRLASYDRRMLDVARTLGFPIAEL